MKLYETIKAENWCRIYVVHPDGRRCLLGHLMTTENFDQKAYRHVAAVAELLYPDRALGTISAFNDHPETTIEDIIRVCKVADV